MKPKDNYLVTDNGSVRVLSGEIYDNTWNLIFTPKNNLEFREFIDRVEQEEQTKGHLSQADLDVIVAEFST